jgi:heat-inducible transcriptional repressor
MKKLKNMSKNDLIGGEFSPEFSLCDRKREVLRTLIELFIGMDEPEPVGSRTLSKTLDMCAATIRNEMCDLEEMGFLQKPHTSAGRVPSSAAYRYYVDNLMEKFKVTKREIIALRRRIRSKIDELHEIAREFSAVFSHGESMPTFSFVQKPNSGAIKCVKLLTIDPETVMAIIVLTGGASKNKQFRVKKAPSYEALQALENIINSALAGISLSKIGYGDFQNIEREISATFKNPSENSLARSVVQFLHSNVFVRAEGEIFMEGAANILRFPEYNNIEKAKEMLEFFDEKSAISHEINELLSHEKKASQKSGRALVIIGDENKNSRLKGSAVILTRFKTGAETSGVFGVIGPTRIDYRRIIPKLELFALLMSEIFSGKSTDTPEALDGL